MTAVAQLLGVSNLLANSVPMTITSDGIETKGTFMEFARGYMDVVYPKENDPVFSAKFPEALDGSDGLKTAADLQILDYICGNMDRHFGNIFYKFSKNEDGKVIFEGVKGIDNDGSFSVANVKNGIASLAALKNLKVISSDMANVIKNITPEHLSLVLKGSKLNAAELRAAGDRLLQIKERLLEPDKYPEKIRVVEKDAWVNEKLDDLVPPVNQAGVQEKNIFSQIKTAFSPAQIEVMKQRAKAANAAEKALTEVGLKKRDVSVDYRKAEDKITTVVENLEKARLWFRGSKEYKDMLITARACKTMLNDYNSGKKEIPGIDQHFSKMLEVMKERTNNYINKKAADGAAKVSSNTVKRVLAAYDTLDFICKFGEKQELSLRQDYHLQNFEANNNQPQRERAASLTEAKSRPDTNIVGLNL